MEVAMSPNPTSPDFHFTISATAPSSPRLFGNPSSYDFHYTSAPTSPARSAFIFSNYDNDDDDFAFDSGRLSIANTLPEISTADELFDNGRIRPLHPPLLPVERGRKRSSFTTNSENRARVSRSLSPLRHHNTTEASSNVVLPKSDSGSRKWRIRDLLLFRSVSEGRATGRGSRDPLRNYALLSSLFSSNCSASSSSPASSKKGGREESNGAPARRGGRRQVASAHEMHYTANRATADEQRKKTPLAYQRQGLFGFIQYNPAIRSITKGFSGNSSSKP